MYDIEDHQTAQSTLIAMIDVDSLVAALQTRSAKDFNGGGSGDVELVWILPRSLRAALREYTKPQIANSITEELKRRLASSWLDHIFVYDSDILMRKPSAFGKGYLRVHYAPSRETIVRTMISFRPSQYRTLGRT